MLVVPALLISLLFALAGLVVWLAARLFKVPLPGRIVLKYTLFCWLMGLPLLLTGVAPLLLSHFVATHGTRSWERSLATTPEDFGSPYREVEFLTADGPLLKGWYLRGGAGKPTIVLGHGLFRSRHEVLERACALNRRGFTLLVFDFRNHGKSQAGITSLGYQERLDMVAAQRFVKATEGDGRVVLMGISMGAVAAIQAGPQLGREVQAIIADSPFASLRETVAHHTRLLLGLPSFPFADVFVWNLTRMAGYRGEKLDNLQALGRTEGVPVLLIYGREDRRMPPTTAQSVLEAIPARRKRLVFFEGAGHAAAYRTDPEGYLDVIEEFLTTDN